MSQSVINFPRVSRRWLMLRMQFGLLSAIRREMPMKALSARAAKNSIVGSLTATCIPELPSKASKFHDKC